MKIRAAAIQIEPVFGDVARNLASLKALIGQVADADLIVAPELATTGYDLDRLRGIAHTLAEPSDGPTVQALHSLAAEVAATLVVGFLEIGDDASIYDSAVITSPSGTTTYRKTHLYPPELNFFSPGDQLMTTRVPRGPMIGTMICFEHAFPEIATTLALAGSDVIVIPSAVPEGFEHLLELRTRARAQDNQVFVVASNLVGGGFMGGSLIVDPMGRVLASAGSDEGVISASLDLDEIQAERSREPALQLRRPDLYR